MPEDIKKTIYFPEHYPPFQRCFFTDDKGQLGPMAVPLPALSKNGLLYHMREKESGFKELVVFKMIWQ